MLDEERNFLGVFSEKCCMRILVANHEVSRGRRKKNAGHCNGTPVKFRSALNHFAVRNFRSGLNCVSSYEECEKPGRLCFRGLLVEVCLALVGVASPAQFKYTKSHSPKQPGRLRRLAARRLGGPRTA